MLTGWRRCLEGKPAETRGLSLVARTTIDRLREGFLREVAGLRERADSGELVRMLTALEQVRVHVDGNEAQQFRRMFAGRSALDLVVEVSHDMRSPLTAILLLTDTLRRAPAELMSPIARRQVSLVYSAAFGLHAMANDVIELARGGERLVDTEPMSLSVGEILEGVGDIVRPMAEEKQLQLHIVHPTVDSRIGHPLALSRVLVNLTTNALKFTREGEVRVIARELSRSVVEFAVEDTGMGIPDEVMATLCQPFRTQKLEAAASRAFSSAGLGLAICRRLVRAMDSELCVQTAKGEGTRFSFVLSLPPTADEF